MKLTLLTICLLMLFPISPSAKALDYYCCLFGSDSEPPTVRKCHTWGTFAAVQPDTKQLVTEFTISWEPIDEFRLFEGRVPGHNIGTLQSLNDASDENRMITMYGPYQITAKLFDEARMRQRELSSGNFSYRAAPGKNNKKDESTKPPLNCIQALGNIPDAGQPLNNKLATSVRFGAAATALVALHYQECHCILDKVPGDYNWLLPQLHFEQYRIIRKQIPTLTDLPTN